MREKEKNTSIYFVRHGQTDYPLDRIYCDGVENPQLNRNGLIQAKSASLYFKDKNIKAIYASPALRTQSTAGEIAQVTGLDIETNGSWVERRFGIWEGLYFSEIEQQYPDEFLKWKKDKVGYTPQDGETIDDVQTRLIESLNVLVKKHSGESVVVVSHVGPIRVAICHSLGIPLLNYRQIRVDYASISRVDYGQTLNNLINLNYLNY